LKERDFHSLFRNVFPPLKMTGDLKGWKKFFEELITYFHSLFRNGFPPLKMTGDLKNWKTFFEELITYSPID
jgi:hypothetical protein